MDEPANKEPVGQHVFSHRTVEAFERIWMVLAFVALIVFTVLMTHAVLTHGGQIATTDVRTSPAEILAQQRFVQPGVLEVGPNQFEISMVAQAFNFVPNEVRLPEGAEVTFYLTSRDVLHGYKIKDTNVNVELIPGEVSVVSHTFNQAGEYPIICHQYCGIGHHNMVGMLVVETQAEIAQREAELAAQQEQTRLQVQQRELEAQVTDLQTRLEQALPVQTAPGQLEWNLSDLPAEARSLTVSVTTADGRTVSSVFETQEAIERIALNVLGEETDLLVAPAPEAEAAEVEEAAELPAAPAPADFDWQALGESVFGAQCSSCHQPTGQGVPAVFPPLAGHAPELVQPEGGRAFLINTVLYGLQGPISVHGQAYNGVMPAFAHLGDDDIAAVLNHVLHAWNNEGALPADFSVIVPGEVAALRGQGLNPSDVHGQRQEIGLE